MSETASVAKSSRSSSGSGARISSSKNRNQSSCVGLPYNSSISIAGKEGNPNACAYSSSKAGVIGLTKSLGKELALNNIAVNCLTPALAKTKIIKQHTKEFTNYVISKIPRGRLAEVNELASMVTWLSSEENSFSTAAVFDLSGGRATY